MYLYTWYYLFQKRNVLRFLVPSRKPVPTLLAGVSLSWSLKKTNLDYINVAHMWLQVHMFVCNLTNVICWRDVLPTIWQNWRSYIDGKKFTLKKCEYWKGTPVWNTGSLENVVNMWLTQGWKLGNWVTGSKLGVKNWATGYQKFVNLVYKGTSVER